MARKQQREHINCYDRTTDGHDVTVAEIGYKSNGKAAIFLWCRAHRRFHAYRLEQMLEHFRALSDADAGLRSGYLAVLNHAIVDVEEHDTMVQKEESA